MRGQKGRVRPFHLIRGKSRVIRTSHFALWTASQVVVNVESSEEGLVRLDFENVGLRHGCVLSPEHLERLFPNVPPASLSGFREGYDFGRPQLEAIRPFGLVGLVKKVELNEVDSRE